MAGNGGGGLGRWKDSGGRQIQRRDPGKLRAGDYSEERGRVFEWRSEGQERKTDTRIEKVGLWDED